VKNGEQTIYTHVNCTVAFSAKYATRIKTYIAKIFIITLYNFYTNFYINFNRKMNCVCCCVCCYN